MASWVKNQIAKQLAKFAKNLDPNSLSLKFFKGEGELTNLELDEAMLSDLMEFPPWLQLTKVTCNRISAKVPWTSLKSDPIRLHLDCVEVQVVASETAREKATNAPAFGAKANAKPNKYGFAEKVVDGMYISINTLMVSFTSVGFKANVSISRIVVQSTTPDWKQTNNLRQTRIKDDIRGEVLNFKEIKWGTMRVDADAAYQPESTDIPSTPLRLITNNSAIRLVIKKRMSDCEMLASKLGIILDDILWVLTRSQLLKLSSFIHYLIKLRRQFLPLAHQSASLHQKQEATAAAATTTQPTTSQNQLFSSYDLAETSIHLRTQRIDLHLCDDSSLDGNLPRNASTSKKINYDESGAALQISLVNIALDHCPYHVVGQKRTAVKIDDDVAFQRKRWATQLMNNFQETEGKKWKTPRNTATSLGSPKDRRRRRPVMYESFFVVNCQEFQIMQVTTSSSLEPKPFLSSNKEALFLPKEMAAVHVDHTTYYYTESEDLSVPAPNLFMQVNPILLTFDPLTCVWLNRFAQSVMTGLDWTKEFMSHESGFVEHVNIRIEALMPKITIPLKNDKSLPHIDERPTGMHIQISQAVVSNCRVGSKSSQADILNDLQSFIGSRHYADMSCFPNQSEDLMPLSNSSWLNDFSINYHQLQNLTRRDKELYARLKRDNNCPHQIWCVWCDQLWMEFTGIEKASCRPVSFLDAFPLRLWICQDVPYYVSPVERSVSPSSGSSVEMAMEPKEEEDIQKSVTMSNKPPHRSSSDSNFNQTNSPRGASASNSPLHLPANRNMQPDLLNPNKSKFYFESLETHERSHSETDLSHTGGERVTSPYDTYSLKDFESDKTNYAQGGPPPPYNDGPSSVFSNSVSSLPPAYDAVTETPGEIYKQPITDIIDYGTENSNQKASLAMLINITKTVQIQLDHFQLLYLLRIGEVFQSVMERVTLDNGVCEREREASLSQWKEVEQLEKQVESLILNISIPDIIVDLVLAPCFGIDPIQQLSLPDRILYDKEISEHHLQSELINSNNTMLPVRRSASKSSSISSSKSSTPERKISFSTNQGELFQSQVYEKLTQNPRTPRRRRSEGSFTNSPVNYATDMLLGNSENESSEHFDETLKEVRDMGVQAGNSLMTMNLKPRPENQLVSIFRARLSCVTVNIDNIGDNSVIKVAAESLEVNEHGNVKYGKILDPRGNIVPVKDKEKQQVNMNTLTGDGVFKMRLTVGPAAEQFAKGGEELGFADIRIKSLAAALLMSTIDNLTEFGEDEFVLPTMPFTVDISCSDISLYDDKPRRSKSAIKLPPMQVLIDSLFVQRDCSGVITLNYKQQNEQNSGQQQSIMSNLASFNSRVRSASVNSTLIAESINQQVDALIGENGRLLEDLKVVNAKVNGLHSERESLLKVIDKLQQELMYSNRENDELQNRVRSMSLNKSRGNYV